MGDGHSQVEGAGSRTRPPLSRSGSHNSHKPQKRSLAGSGAGFCEFCELCDVNPTPGTRKPARPMTMPDPGRARRRRCRQGRPGLGRLSCEAAGYAGRGRKAHRPADATRAACYAYTDAANATDAWAAFAAAASSSRTTLARLRLGSFPELGGPIDPSESGPLGPFVARGRAGGVTARPGGSFPPAAGVRPPAHREAPAGSDSPPRR
jgi:hypothetical protein